MPNPAFVPVIGSGFDADAAQQFNWANFNRQQDEANIGRMLRANDEYNRWLATASAMDREDARYGDQQQRFDEATQYNRYLQAKHDIESGRRFNEQMKLSQAAIDADKSRYDAAMKDKLRLELKAEKIHENTGKNMVEEVRSAGQAFEDAQKDHDGALTDFKTGAAQWESKIPASKARYNPRTNEFEATNRLVGIPKDIEDTVTQANADLSRRMAAYLNAKQDLDYRTKVWNSIQQHAYQNGLIVKGSGKTAYLYSPTLNKSFGQLLEEAKAQNAASGPVLAQVPALGPTPGALRVGGVTFGKAPAAPSSAPRVFFGAGQPTAAPAGTVSIGGVQFGTPQPAAPPAAEVPSVTHHVFPDLPASEGPVSGGAPAFGQTEPIVFPSASPAPTFSTGPVLGAAPPFGQTEPIRFPATAAPAAPLILPPSAAELADNYRPGQTSFEEPLRASNYPSAPKDPSLRRPGQVYMTPTGLARWVNIGGQLGWTAVDRVGLWMDRNVGAPIATAANAVIFPPWERSSYPTNNPSATPKLTLR